MTSTLCFYKKQSVEVMSKHFKQDKKVLKQSADWTSYGDLTIIMLDQQNLYSQVC
jgi:hypothetical protein